MTWVNPFNTVSLGGGGGSPIVMTEPISLSSTGVAPAKPTAPAVDYITAIDDGSGWCSLQMHLASGASMVGASIGSGFYLWRLPGGLRFDLTAHVPISNPAANLQNPAEFGRMIPGSFGMVGNGNSSYSYLSAAAYDATRFVLIIHMATWYKVGQGAYELNPGGSASYTQAFRFKKG